MNLSNCIVIMLVSAIIIFIICNSNSKSTLVNTQNKYITGFWTNDNEETYLYINPDINQDNSHNGYIVRGDSIKEPLRILIENKGENKIKLLVKGTDSLKKKGNVVLDMSKGTMIIQNKDGSDLELKKD